MPLLRCEHPGVVMKTAEMGKPHTQVQMWFECAQCGAREPFQNFSAITAREYNLKRGFEEEKA